MAADHIETDAFQTLEAIQRSSSASEIYETFGDYLQGFGFAHFLITEMPPPGFDLAPHMLLSGWSKDWTDRYIAAKHFDHDPMAKLTREVAKPFLWSEASDPLDLNPRAKRVMDEASEHGLKDGFSVPIHGASGQLSCVTMGGEQLELPPRAREAIYLTSVYALDAARGFREDWSAYRPDRGKPRLTKREREVLIWVALGKTDSEIGEICGISHETAYSHVKNCVSKYHAANRTQAVVRALISGEIKL